MSASRIAAVLSEIDADVVALQEVPSMPDDLADALTYLSQEVGARAILGVTMLRDEARYGNALLTRLPVQEVRRHDLSVPGREPRGALDVDVLCDGRMVQVIATHLGLRPGERRRQVRRLLTFLDVSRNSRIVLAGDLNEWFLWGRPLRWLRRIFPSTLARRTWPAHCPVFALDRVWAYPSNALLSLEVHKSAVAHIASDHLPLVAKIAFEA